MAKKEHRTGAKDGGGNFYPSQASIADPGYSPIYDGKGTGGKDGGGSLYSSADDITSLGHQPNVVEKGVGSRYEPGGKEGSVLAHRMENLHAGNKTEDRRFRRGGK